MMKKIICILLAITLCNIPALTFEKVQAAEDIYSVALFEDDFEASTQVDTDSDEDGLPEGNITTEYNQVTETWKLSMLADNKEKALHTYESTDSVRGDKGLALYDEYKVWNEKDQAYKGGTGKSAILKSDRSHVVL